MQGSGGDCGAAAPRPARLCPAASAGQPTGGGAAAQAREGCRKRGAGAGEERRGEESTLGGHRPPLRKALTGHRPPPAARRALTGRRRPASYRRPAIVPRRKQPRCLRAAAPPGASGSPGPPCAGGRGSGRVGRGTAVCERREGRGGAVSAGDTRPAAAEGTPKGSSRGGAGTAAAAAAQGGGGGRAGDWRRRRYLTAGPANAGPASGRVRLFPAAGRRGRPVVCGARLN